LPPKAGRQPDHQLRRTDSAHRVQQLPVQAAIIDRQDVPCAGGEVSEVVTTALWMIFGLAGGASLVVQAGLNAALRARLESISWAGFVSYLGGTLAMLIAIAIERTPLQAARVQGTPLAWWLGGLFGAAYLAVSIILIPRFGAATLVTLVVAGQLICSMVCDHFGWLGVPVHSFDLKRLAGAILLIAGVLFVRK
jgi:transporter family-2 protein